MFGQYKRLRNEWVGILTGKGCGNLAASVSYIVLSTATSSVLCTASVSHVVSTGADPPHLHQLS